MSHVSLERRVQILQDIEDIKRIKHAYFRCIDTANLDELKTLLDENVETCYIGGGYRLEFSTRADFLEMIANSFHSEAVARHNGHQPEIEIVSETEATGIWYLHDTFWSLSHMTRTEGTALYRDRYIKVDGRWRIKRQAYERIFEIVDQLKERPNLTVHYLATHGRKLPKQA